MNGAIRPPQQHTAWAEPLTISARALLETRRYGDAVAKAQVGSNLAPGAYAAEVMLARARFAMVQDSGRPHDYLEMLPHLEHIQQSWPNRDTLALYVTTLARSGKRDEAVAAVKAALAGDPAPAAGVLVALAQVADAEKLGHGQEIRDFAQSIHGLTPEVAFLTGLFLRAPEVRLPKD